MKKIVCAAIKNVHTQQIILGVRHFDIIMKKTIKELNLGKDWIQGFVDNKYNFIDREEAFKIATNANQIVKKTGGENSNELYSEDIY